MRRFLITICALLLMAAGCAGSSDAILERALNNMKPALVIMDQRYALFESGLSSVELYLAKPDEDMLSAAKMACTDSTAQLAELPAAKSDLTNEEKSALVRAGLNIADYSVPFENAEYERNECIQNLAALLYYLDRAPLEDEVLKNVTLLLRQNNTLFRSVDCLCINELFCTFRGDQIDSFKDDFLPGLSTLYKQIPPWDTDSAALMAKADKLMNDAEENIDAYAAFVGERYALMLDMRDQYSKLLADAGYEPDKAQRIIAQIDNIGS